MDVYSYSDPYNMEYIVYFTLDIYYKVYISYYWDLKSFLVVVYYNGKYETMIKVKMLLVKNEAILKIAKFMYP